VSDRCRGCRPRGLAPGRTRGDGHVRPFSLFFSIELKNEREPAFSLDMFADKTFAITTAVSLVLLVLSTVLSTFHTAMQTTRLDVGNG
jgi:hypothetical protein